MISDSDSWILGKIAKQYTIALADVEGISLTAIASNADGFTERFKNLQRSHDIVHFLSPWDYYERVDDVCLPCIVNIWHMVDWSYFDPHLERIDLICSGSEQWAERTAKHIDSKVPVLKFDYGLDTNVFIRNDSARGRFLSERGIGDDCLVLGFSGSASSNQSDRKGLDRLWSCLLHLKKIHSVSFVLRIIGPGWSSNMFPEELQKSIIYDNYLDDTALPEFYSSLDYYVCVSRTEGVPYPVIETMSCEGVVLSTSVGVVPEIVEHGKNGFIIDENDLEENFVSIIKSTCVNRVFREKCGYHARKTIVEKFSLRDSINIEKYLHVCDQAIKSYQERSVMQRMQFYFANKNWF